MANINPMFAVPFESEHGKTLTSPNPKLSAYQQCSYIQNILNRNYQLTAQADGCYTVASDGIEPITFAPMKGAAQ